MNKSLDSIVLRYAGFGLLFLALFYVLYLVRGALPVFLVAGLIAYAVEPLLQRLERKGHSRRSAVGVVFLFFLLLFIVFLGLLASAWQQAQLLAANLSQLSDQLIALAQTGVKRLEQSKLPVGVKESILEAFNSGASTLQQQAPAFATGVAQWVFGSIGTIFITLVLVPIITLWFMLEANPIRGRLLMLVPPAYRLDATDIVASINELLGRYVRGQIIVCSIYGGLCTVAFEILAKVYGMQYPLVLGALAAFIYIVPYIGMAAITATAGLTAYFTATHPIPCAIAAVLSCLSFNLIVDYGITPRVLGKGVGIHPLMVIFALLSGAQLGGPLGMIFAVPVFASLRVIAIYLFPQLAAPLPENSPASTEFTPRGQAAEAVKQTRDAEITASTAGGVE